MPTQNSSNQKFSNDADGFTLGGGTTQRNLTVTGSNVTLSGSGSNTYNFPASADTLVGRASTDTLTNKTLTSPVINTSVSGSAVATAATASTLALRDSNGNLTANARITGFTTTATAAGTTTLTAASTGIQVFTGSTTQTLRLPTTSIAAGAQYMVINNSTGVVTVQSSGANTITTMAASTTATFTSLVATPTTAANWSSSYVSAGGDVAGPASSVDSEVALFSGTSGKTLKRATTTGIAKLTSGVLSAATAGTDYVTPTGTETLSGKTLTAPKMASGGFIADANGNEQIIFTTTPSAVNEITIQNAATGGAPIIKATGGDSDIPLSLQAKGASAVQFLDANGKPQFAASASPAANAVNYTYANNAATGNPAILGSWGTDTNVGLNLVTKGTGTVQANNVDVTTISGNQTLTNKTISGSNNTLSNIPQSAITGLTTDYSKLVCTTAWGSTGVEDGAGAWAKIATFSTGTGQYKECTLILGVTTGSAWSHDSAIISVFFRSNATSQNPTVDVQILSKGGDGVFILKDSFKVISGGWSTDMELWFRKGDEWGGFNFYEISKFLNTGGTLTYTNSPAWQSTTPVGAVNNVSSKGVTAYGNPVAIATDTLPNGNLVIGGDFQTDAQWANAWGSQTTDQSIYAGGKSHQIISSAAGEATDYISLNHDGTGTPVQMPAMGERRYVMHVWLRKKSTNTGGGNVLLQTVRTLYDNSTDIISSPLATSTIDNADWTSFEYTHTVSIADDRFHQLRIALDSGVPAGDTFYIGAVFVSDITGTIAPYTFDVLTNKTVDDDSFTIQDGSDNSKTVQFSLVNLTTGTNVTLNVPNVAAGTHTLVSRNSTDTLLNKRITPRVITTTSSATPTINTGNVDIYGLTAQAVDITSFSTNLSGTPTDGQKLLIYIVGTATRAITWGASFENGAAPLPANTDGTKRLDVGFIWNATTSKWRCMAVGSN